MPGEQRCTDLGVSCLCSAPFNNNDFPTASTETAGTFSDDYDANGGQCLFIDSTGITLQSVDAFDTPAGFSGKVLSYYNATSSSLVHSPFDWGNDICSTVPNAKRVSVRVYKRYSENASYATSTTGPPDNEIKFMESQTFQGNSGPGGDSVHFRMVDGTCDQGTTPGPNVATMKGEWVRWEFAFSAPSGDLCDAGGPIELYVQTKRVTNGTINNSSITGCTDDQAFGGRYIDKIGYNGWDNTNTDPDQLTYLSHYMVAAWTTTDGANGPWIGAASEIEGAGGAGSDIRGSMLGGLG